MNVSAESVVMGLLALLCGFLTYWGTRLEARLDKVKADLNTLKAALPVDYVRRDDWKERSAELLAHLANVEHKLDRLNNRRHHHED